MPDLFNPPASPRVPDSGRPRDRATVQRNHRANAARAGGKYDRAILDYIDRRTPEKPGDWGPWFRFEHSPDALFFDSCAWHVRNLTGSWPAADTCRRRGTALADEHGFVLDLQHGRGLYRATRKPQG